MEHSNPRHTGMVDGSRSSNPQRLVLGLLLAVLVVVCAAYTFPSWRSDEIKKKASDTIRNNQAC